MKFDAGGTIVFSYTDGTDRWELRVPCADFDPVTFAYTGTGLKVPTEADIAATVANFGGVWAPYFDPTWTLTLEALFHTSGGTGTRLATLPSVADVTGTSSTPSSANPPLMRGFQFTLANGRRQVVRFFSVATTTTGARREVTATSGGFDGRDQAVMAYLAGPSTGLVAWDGQIFPPTASAYQRYKLAPFERGGGGGGSSPPGDCITFPRGASICNDAADVVHVRTPGATHALDLTGYQLPHLHRLEERLINQAPDPTDPLVLEAVPSIEAPWPAGTYAFAYTYVTNRGKQTGLSPPASITLDGTQEVKAHSPALPPPPSGGFWVDIDIYLLAPVPMGSGVYAGFVNDTGLASFATLFPPMSPGGDPPAANETGTLGVLLVAPGGSIDWQHDGTRFTVNQGSTAVLEAPLPALDATPATLVGQDPASGLPAFCPPPAPSPAQLLTPPVPPTALPDCAQARCGLAVAMEQHLESLYDQWAQWLGPLAGVGGALITAGFLVLTLDPFFDLAALAEAKVVWQVIRDTIIGLTGDEVNNMLSTLSPAMITEVQRLVYCQLTCADNVVTPTHAQIQAWEHGVYSSPTLGLNVLQNALLVALLQFTPLQDWQVVASTAQPSPACAAWVCP